ncbi:hypothetical protein OPT61_g7556 [Boeremia exigua]|uniref:Uncharacterized protein n=1 Tax=Boeremia exigua TaxID=749465 RepID=A0ACC2I348_9PLEO|nr:hypothetical protein OPT61_g7556 [Boeremia exigua]
MVMNFLTPLCRWAPSEAWITRFLNHHSDVLINAWCTPIDSNRHHADSIDRYRLYFELLHRKIAEYNVLPEDTYNMDEKGFAIGVAGRSKRIFDKVLYDQKQFRKSLHNGNREWVTLLATICADGSVLPPGIIYPAAGRDVQASWVAPIDPKKHDIFFTTSPTGWTNDDLGITWLEQVFERYTAPKARRRWRLLILDGHGSHVTKAFIDYCDAHKILLMIYPPHSTHTLQPLDVVCFALLAQNYTKELDYRTQRSQGILSISLSDFFDLFWPAWVTTFTKTLVETSFLTTGIYPPNADVVLDKLKVPTPPEPATPPEQTAITAAPTAPNWLKAKALLRQSVGGEGSTQLGPLEQAIHQLHVQFELVQHELNEAKEELSKQRKRPKRQKVLPLYTRQIERQGGAVWWSPSSKAEADARDRANEAYQEHIQLPKALKRKLPQSAAPRKKQNRGGVGGSKLPLRGAIYKTLGDDLFQLTLSQDNKAEIFEYALSKVDQCQPEACAILQKLAQWDRHTATQFVPRSSATVLDTPFRLIFPNSALPAFEETGLYVRQYAAVSYCWRSAEFWPEGYETYGDWPISKPFVDAILEDKGHDRQGI